MARAFSKPIPALLYLTAAVLLFAFAAVASAETAESEAIMEDCSFPTATSASFQQGLRAWIDPVTGELREPTDEELQSIAKRRLLDSLLNRSHEGLEFEVKPNGARIVHLKGRFMHVLVATRDEHGTIRTECITDEGQLTQARAESVPVR